MEETYLTTHSPLMKSIATVVLITFLMWILEPTAAAAQVIHAEYQQAAAEAAQKPAGQLPEMLEKIENHLEALVADLSTGPKTRRRANQMTEQLEALETLNDQLPALDEHVQHSFAEVKNHIATNQLPAIIQTRQAQAEQDYQQALEVLQKNLTAIVKADNAEQQLAHTRQALKHLQPFQAYGKHPPFNPNEMPFNVPTGQVRAPFDTPTALQELFPSPTRVRKSQADLPQPADLAESEEVQITADIKALAKELEHDPVKIYNWVHDHIRFIPSYGAIQGSQMTLETKQGNAFDTASLLIALLRTSGIHARYRYGTVLIPIDQAKNWVGGVDSGEAAIQLLGQGGIPTAALIRAGQLEAVKIEHVWVMGWIDFYPSRGARHREGDAWIPLDASFKQYTYTPGMALTEQVPFDAEDLVKQVTETAQVNETEGWVSGMDQELIKTRLQNYQDQLDTYIKQVNPEATVGEVLGTQQIIPANRPALAPGLPYQQLAKTAMVRELPGRLRHQFKYSLYANETDRVIDNPVLSLTENLSNLAGKRLTLSFTPATEADQQVIESYLPKVPEGQELDPNDLPTSLPGYLIHLKAQLKLEGEIVAESGGFTMGQELRSTTGITLVDGGWHLANNKPIAGEFYAFGIDGQSISAKQLEAVKNRMETVKGQLEAKQLEGLTKDGLIGDMLYAAALGYFVANDVNLWTLNRTSQAIAYRLPSFGTISTNLDPIYSFGIPRQVQMSGIMVDMDAVVSSLWAKNNDAAISKTVGQQVGMMTSALEHRIPELFFTSEEHPGEAVSAVKALAVASAEGQRIYQITSANVGVVNSLNIGQEVKEDIRNSVAVGKEATVSQSNITVAGWTGVGYIISDPETGSGAYRISGGSNGGSLTELSARLLIFFNSLVFSVLFASAMAKELQGKTNPGLFQCAMKAPGTAIVSILFGAIMIAGLQRGQIPIAIVAIIVVVYLLYSLYEDCWGFESSTQKKGSPRRLDWRRKPA